MNRINKKQLITISVVLFNFLLGGTAIFIAWRTRYAKPPMPSRADIGGGEACILDFDVNYPPSCDSLTAEPSSGEAPLEVTFHGTAHDQDGIIKSYTLEFGDGETEQGTNSSATLDFTTTHTYQNAGNYTATLTVCDDAGECANGDQCMAKVAVSVPLNKPPICDSLTADPMYITTFKEEWSPPFEVTFSSSAHDDDGIIASYTLDFGDGETETGTNDSATLVFTTTHTYQKTGTYTAILTVCDEDGECADGPQCQVKIIIIEKFLNCESLTMNPEDPKVGEVTFTCIGSSYLGEVGTPGAAIARVRFRIYRDGNLIHEEETTDITDLGGGRYEASITYTINEPGHYGVASSACLSTAEEDPENTLCTSFSPPQ